MKTQKRITELEKEIEQRKRYIVRELDEKGISPKGVTFRLNLELNKLEATLKGLKEGIKLTKAEVLEIIDKFIIGELYGCDEISTEVYDFVVKKWEKIKTTLK